MSASWLAAQARAKACLFRGFGQVEEADAFAMCTTRGARWATVNSGGADGEYELTVETRVFRNDCLPELIVIEIYVHVQHVGNFTSAHTYNLPDSCGQT